MLAVAYESSGKFLPQVSEEDHSRSSPVLGDAPRLLMAYCGLRFVYENAKNVTLATKLPIYFRNLSKTLPH